MVMARLLTPYDFGVAAAATFFLGLASRLTRFGFNNALVRMKELRAEHAASVFAVNLLIGAVLAAAFAVGGGLVGHWLRNADAGRVTMVAGLGFLIGAFGTVPSAMITRNFMFREATYVDWATTWTYAIVAPVLAVSGWGYWSMVVAQLCSGTVQVATNLYLTPWKPTLQFSRSALGELFAFGMGIYAKRILDYGAMNLDSLIVGRSLGMDALGFYEKGFGLMTRLVDRATIGVGTAFRIYSIIFEQHERFRRGFRKQATALGLISIPALTAAAVMGKELIAILFGDRWLPSVLPFQLLCVAGMFKLVNVHSSAAVQAVGHIWSEVSRQAMYVGVLLLSVSVASRWGIVGAAAGVLFATVFMTVAMIHLLGRVSALRSSDVMVPLVPGLVCAGGTAVLSLGVGVMLHSSGIDNKFALAAGQGFIAAVWWFGFLRWNRFPLAREIVSEAIGEFRPKLRKMFLIGS